MWDEKIGRAALVGDFTPWYKNGINIEDKIIGYRG